MIFESVKFKIRRKKGDEMIQGEIDVLLYNEAPGPGDEMFEIFEIKSSVNEGVLKNLVSWAKFLKVTDEVAEIADLAVADFGNLPKLVAEQFWSYRNRIVHHLVVNTKNEPFNLAIRNMSRRKISDSEIEKYLKNDIGKFMEWRETIEQLPLGDIHYIEN